MADPQNKPQKTRSLSAEERALWRAVGATVDRSENRKPLPAAARLPSLHQSRMTAMDATGRPRAAHAVPPETVAKDKAQEKRKTTPAPRISADPYYPPQSGKTVRAPTDGSGSSRDSISAIDDRTARKILRGRVSIEDRIDLHGLTQADAHLRLERFLHHAHARGLRHVLVITGKGRTTGGILRQMVPLWLREPRMSLYASAVRTAHVSHGGEGALYVRIRRQKRAPQRAVASGN